jgi:hypothetical protein
MRTQFRLLAVTGALGAVVPVAGAQSASSYFTGAPRVDVAVLAPATGDAASSMRDIVARAPLPAFAAPVRDDRTDGLAALRSDFGGVALHRDGDAPDALAFFGDEASSDESEERESGSASGGGGIGLMPVLGALAGGGAAWAAIAASNASSSAAPVVSANPVGVDGPAGVTNALPSAELNPVIVNPEPSTLVLMATGTAGLLVLARRRRRTGA